MENALHWLLPEWLWHPLGNCVGTHAEQVRCWSYNFHSGISGELVYLGVLATLLTGLAAFLKRHNCHVHRCLRLSWHLDENGHPVCKVHHPEHPKAPGVIARLITRLRGSHDGYVNAHVHALRERGHG